MQTTIAIKTNTKIIPMIGMNRQTVREIGQQHYKGAVMVEARVHAMHGWQALAGIEIVRMLEVL